MTSMFSPSLTVHHQQASDGQEFGDGQETGNRQSLDSLLRLIKGIFHATGGHAQQIKAL